jgi:6-phosphofructokinase 1
MIALQSPHIVTVPLTAVLKTPKRVEIDHDTVFTARATGISFGD